MPETISDKVSLRRTLLANRQTLTAEVRRQADAAISTRILAWLNANPLQTLGVYWPIRGEPDLRALYETLAARGIKLALPIVTAHDAPLVFVKWQPGDAMVKDAFGVMVPQHTAAVLRPDALLIPCVGFNAHNIRLGYGGGFYDRTLAVLPRPAAIGIAYRCCRADFGTEAHDVALDDVMTE